MLKAGVVLLVAGLLALAIGYGGGGPFDRPLGGGWHITVFPTGLGVLLLVAGASVHLRMDFRFGLCRSRDSRCTGC
jgi:hypothetical protein